jgi:hypothetical protein
VLHTQVHENKRFTCHLDVIVYPFAPAQGIPCAATASGGVLKRGAELIAIRECVEFGSAKYNKKYDLQ